MQLDASYVHAFPWEHNQRVNFFMTHYGHGPGEVVRGFALESKMPCPTLDFSAVMEDQTGYACEELPHRHVEDKPERTDADRAADAAYRRFARLRAYLLAAGGNDLEFDTFTFRDAVEDQKEAAKAWYNFTRRWLVHYKKPLKALWVYERGEDNGRIHIHAIIIPPKHLWKSTLEELWGAGFVDKQFFAAGGRARGAKAIERYMSKYMGKAGAREGLSRERTHHTEQWPAIVTKAVGLADDPLNTAEELCERAKAAGCPARAWRGELEDGTKYVGFEVKVSGGARFMPDIRLPVKLLLLRRVPLAQTKRKESVIFYNHIEAQRLGARVVYMSTANLTYRERFKPGDFIQWAKGF